METGGTDSAGSADPFTMGMTAEYKRDVDAASSLYQGGNLPEIKTIALLGAGVLGSCVVTELAFSGVEINVYDRSPVTRAEVALCLKWVPYSLPCYFQLKNNTRRELNRLQYDFLKESIDAAVDRIHPMDTAEEGKRQIQPDFLSQTADSYSGEHSRSGDRDGARGLGVKAHNRSDG
jgi:hypothetical protein